MKTQQCPTDQKLSSFDLGNLPAEEYEQCYQHLEECGDCARRFEALLPQDDSVVMRLRQPLPAEALADDAELDELAERAFARMETANPYESDTSVGIRGSSADLQLVIRQILKPAVTEDELGLLGHYRVLRVLGSGGMGVVFEAEDTLLHRRVALKVMKPSIAADPSATERFLREARGMAAIEHEHVITIHQVGEGDNVPFMAMQLLKGESLADRLARDGRLPVNEALRIAREVAAGLGAAHETGLVHRDIKPDNIWLEAESGRVKLLDFGLARALDGQSKLTQSGMIVGTPNYLAPEQAAGEPVDARSDLFSLGVVLYHTITGKRPFERRTLPATLAAIASDAPLPLDAAFAHLNPAVRNLIEKLLAKDPEQRFTTSGEVIRAIDAAQTQPANRTRSALRSRTAVFGGLAALVLLAAIIVVIKDKHGNTIATLEFPDGENAKVFQAGADSVSNVAARPSEPGMPMSISPVTDGSVLPPMGRLAMVQRPARLQLSDGTAPVSHTIETAAMMGYAAAAVSPDGKHVATFSEDVVVRIWNAQSRELVQMLIGHHSGPPRRQVRSEIGPRFLFWHPNSRKLGVVDDGGELRIWDSVTGKLEATFEDAQAKISNCRWSPNGRQLAVRLDDHTGRILNDEAEVVRQIQHPGTGGWQIAWSPDSRTLATGQGSFLYLWDPLSGKARRFRCPSAIRTAGTTNVVVWSPNGQQLAACCEAELVICDVNSKSSDAPAVLRESAAAAEWSRDGSELFAVLRAGRNPDDVCELVRFQSGMETGRIELFRRADEPVHDAVSMAFLADNENLLVHLNSDSHYIVNPGSSRSAGRGFIGRGASHASFDGKTNVIWHRDRVTVNTNAVENGHHSAWNDLPSTPSVHSIVCAETHLAVSVQGASYSQVVVLNRQTGRLVLPASGTLASSPRDLDITSNGKFVMLCAGPTCVVYSLETRKKIAEFKSILDGNAANRIGAGCFSPDGTEIALAGDGVTIHDTATGAAKRHLKLPGQPHDVAWSPGGQSLAVTIGSEVHVCESATGSVRAVLKGGYCENIEWSPGGVYLAGICDSQSLFVWDVGRQNVVLNRPLLPAAIRFENDTRLTYVTRAGRVITEDVESGKEIRNIQVGIGSAKASLTPDGRQLLEVIGNRIFARNSHDASLQATIIPFLGNRSSSKHGWAVISHDGHYFGSNGLENHLRHVVRTAEGTRLLTPFEYQQEFGWKSNSKKVRPAGELSELAP